MNWSKNTFISQNFNTFQRRFENKGGLTNVSFDVLNKPLNKRQRITKDVVHWSSCGLVCGLAGAQFVEVSL